MNKDIVECMGILGQLETFESFTRIRKYHVDLLIYWSKLIAHRAKTQSTQGYYEILAKLSDLAIYLDHAADMPNQHHHLDSTRAPNLTSNQNAPPLDRVQRERAKYVFLSKKMLEMVRFLTANPDTAQLSDMLKMYAVQFGRLRCLDEDLLDDAYAAGMDRMAAELSPKWRGNVNHWHCSAWTELQLGMNV